MQGGPLMHVIAAKAVAFKEAMQRRLGRSGIFVEVNGKYYLNEERLKELREQRAQGRSGRSLSP
jgi:glycine/serine hydroxymethyltransferase